MRGSGEGIEPSTYCRKGAIEELKWNDIEFSAENDPLLRTSPPDAYVIPMADKLAMVKMSFLPIGFFPLSGETANTSPA